MKILADLFLTFARIGMFTFGGGYAMLSLIENICVEKKEWISHDDLMDIVVIAESTPGPVAINCATYIGYKKCGLPGAAIATIGVTLPSFVIIYIISQFLEGFLAIKWIAGAFQGIKLAVGLLIIDAAVKMMAKMDRRPLKVGIMVVSLSCVVLANALGRHVSSVMLMLAAAVVGEVVYLADKVKAERKVRG
jgi:chromate transporter